MKYKLHKTSRLYGAGGFYDQQTPLADIEDIADDRAWQISELAEVYPMESYSRPASNILTSDPAFRDIMDALSSDISRDYRLVPPSLALEIRNCIIHDNIIYLVEDDGLSILYTTCRDHDRPHIRLLNEEQGVVTADTYLNDGRRLVYMTSAASFNYGHWLIDDLPRIKFLLDTPCPTTLVLQASSAVDKARLESIDFFTQGLDIRIVLIDKKDIVACDAIIHVTPVSYHPVIKSGPALHFIRDFADRHLPMPRKDFSKIFVRRRQSRSRALVNMSEVEAVVSAFGFTIIDPEDYTFVEQAEIFRSASIVVGIMGASMCNTIFCAPHTHLIYLAPNSWVEPFYWDMASQLQHEYIAIYGERQYADDKAAFDNFAIDLDGLVAAVQAKLALNVS